jgi:NhaP-type Na+/H+ or K+/H+ antiporter
MYLGVHYFVDVVTGLILGLLIAKTAQLGIKKIKTHQVQAESLSYVWALGIVAVSIAVLFWSAVDKLAFGILGFYIGFYLFKRLKLRHDEHKLKQLTGFLGFGLIAVFYWLASAWVILWLFILGLWISLGNPLLHQAADEAVER